MHKLQWDNTTKNQRGLWDDSDDEWNLSCKLISRHSISMIRSYWQVWNKYGHYNRDLSASFYVDCHISYSIMETI